MFPLLGRLRDNLRDALGVEGGAPRLESDGGEGDKECGDELNHGSDQFKRRER